MIALLPAESTSPAVKVTSPPLLRAMMPVPEAAVTPPVEFTVTVPEPLLAARIPAPPSTVSLVVTLRFPVAAPLQGS